MKRIQYCWLLFLSFLIFNGCGSGKGDGATQSTESNLTTSKISSEVGIVLNLLTGETTPGKEGTQLQKIKKQSVTSLYRHSIESLTNQEAKDMDACQYGGRESYIPEIVDYNTMRETYIYDWCKNDHPIFSHLMERHNGLYVSEETDPDYTGSNPLQDPSFIPHEWNQQKKDFTAERYDSATGVLLTYSYYPEFYRRSSWEYGNEPVQSPGISAYNISKYNMWITGSAYSTETQGTPQDPSDDSVYEDVYKDYHSEEFFSDYYYNPQTASGGARRQDITENGYAKVAWEDRKTGRKFLSAASYEDFTTKRYRSRPSEKDDVLTSSVDGAIIPDSCSGKKFVLKTLLPLYMPAGSLCPVEGEIVVTSNDREVTLRFRNNQTVEVDTNGDGIVDETVSCQTVTASDFCM